MKRLSIAWTNLTIRYYGIGSPHSVSGFACMDGGVTTMVEKFLSRGNFPDKTDIQQLVGDGRFKRQ